MGSLTTEKDPWSLDAMKRAMVYGTVLASYTVRDFSTKPLQGLKRDALDARCEEFLSDVRLPKVLREDSRVAAG